MGVFNVDVVFSILLLATGYQIRYSYDISDFKKDFNVGKIVTNNMIIKRETSTKYGEKTELRIISLDEFENNQTFAIAVKSYSLQYEEERISNYDMDILIKNVTSKPSDRSPVEHHQVIVIVAVLSVALLMGVLGFVGFYQSCKTVAIKK